MVDLGVGETRLPALADMGVHGSPAAGADGDSQLDQTLGAEVEPFDLSDRPAELAVVVPYLRVTLDDPLKKLGQFLVLHQSKLTIRIPDRVMPVVPASRLPGAAINRNSIHPVTRDDPNRPRFAHP